MIGIILALFIISSVIYALILPKTISFWKVLLIAFAICINGFITGFGAIQWMEKTEIIRGEIQYEMQVITINDTTWVKINK